MLRKRFKEGTMQRVFSNEEVVNKLGMALSGFSKDEYKKLICERFEWTRSEGFRLIYSIGLIVIDSR